MSGTTLSNGTWRSVGEIQPFADMGHGTHGPIGGKTHANAFPAWPDTREQA